MGKSKGKQATKVANEQRRDNEAMSIFFFSVEIYGLLSAAKCEHIPPYLKKWHLFVRDFCFALHIDASLSGA